MLPQLANSSFSSMNRITNLLLLLIVIQTTSFVAGGALQPQHYHGGGCVPAERAALLSFKMGITNDSTNLLGSWHGQDCCRWRGIKCSSQSGQVVQLHLRSPTLNFYYDGCHNANALLGEISHSLLSLKHLEHLDLSMNCLQGPHGRIPHFLGSMENLRYLNLSGMRFTGRVPSQLGNLSKLQYLDLGASPEGYSTDYSTDITWLTKLPLLQYLSMAKVNLSGIADWPRTLNMIPSLRVISLSGCSLDSSSQSLPHFNLTELEKIDLSSNYLGHSVASGWFWKANKLQELHLWENSFTGTLPNFIGHFTSLRILDLSANNLVGPIPPGLWNLKYLATLDFSSNQLSGSLPAEIQALTSLVSLGLGYNYFNGNVPTEIGSLPNLIDLDLGGNNFSGVITEEHLAGLKSLKYIDLSFNNLKVVLDSDWLPPFILRNAWFASCQMGPSLPTWLQHQGGITKLDLSGNQLVGPVPPGLWNLKYLTTLDLSMNQLVGPIPPGLWNLKYLTTLDLSMNQLVGPIPPGLWNLKYLTTLFFSANQLSGSLPAEIQALTSLVSLELSYNNFNGNVPTEISSLPNLIDLSLARNNFSGVITEEHLAGLKSLQSIDLSSNNLKVLVNSDWLPPFILRYARFASCQMGPSFPTWLQHHGGIIEIDISNTGLKGEIPDWFWSTFSQATYLNISNNQISGSLPAHLDGMSVEYLYLGSNWLTGTIPSLPTNIILLDISNNTFSGTLPSNLEASQLQILLINSNRIGGYLPESICKLQLSYLDLSNNVLEGEFPQCFDGQNLQILLLSNNSLSGKFPTFLRNSTSLEFLDLSWNKFSGRLPAWIGELGILRFLILRHNIFCDNIPVEITNLGYLQYLDLSGNNFSGAIPSHLTYLTLKELRNKFMSVHSTYTPDKHSIGYFDLGGIFSVVTKGQQLIYGTSLLYFMSIDLSSNSLTGEIPSDISSLDALINLNLSSNQLSGQIPRMIGAMQSLKSLDLSRNKLSGEIPSSLSSLSFLSYLNLSYNNLSGRIPSGRQLDTLDADNPSLMYIGNSGLCGPPLQKNCLGNDTIIHGHLSGSKQEFEPITFYFGLVLGLVTGHWMVFCALLFKKTWRITYFRFLDKLYDMIYVFVVVNRGSFTKNTTTE